MLRSRLLGPVRYLISPNALHHLFLAEWKCAYPDARLYASPRLPGKRKDLAFHAALADAPEPEWAADIDQVVVHGSFFLTEVVFFHRHRHTALFADLIQNFPRDWFKGWRGVVARLGGIVAPIQARRAIGARVSLTVARRDRHSAGFSLGQSSEC